MIYQDAIKLISGFRYITEQLEIQSPAGRQILSSIPWLKKKKEIEKTLTEVEQAYVIIKDKSRSTQLSLLLNKLEDIRYITPTFDRLKNGMILNDIEFFEIKHFTILAKDINRIAKKLQIDFFSIPCLEEVITTLDPEKKEIPHFYIYDVYSDNLAKLREKINNSKQENISTESLKIEAEKLEDEIRKSISEKLAPHTDNLKTALLKIAHLDIIIAKANLAINVGLSKPKIVEEKTKYNGLFHPKVSNQLEKKGKKFQPVDIDISLKPTVITGANMTGKSVLLMSVALAQTMMQFGFFVPAAYAEITPVDNVLISAGDNHDELNGLSSFASEMMIINRMTERLLSGENLLVLIDELARTTNPSEGSAIVSGTLDFLNEHSVRSLITTHYSINTDCRKLRVKGFIEKSDEAKIDLQNINNYIDYSLEEEKSNKVPHEALRIAEIIGVSKELTNKFRHYINDSNQENNICKKVN